MPKDSSKKDKKEKKEKKEKKSKKSKKESEAASGAGADAAPESIREPTIPVVVSDIAKPLAGKKLGLDVLRLVQKAALSKELKRGVKEVIKSIRKGGRGLVVLAGDIYPEDVISHIPIYCEEQGVPCVFVESKQQLGSAARTKRATSVVMVPDSGSLKSRAEDLLPGIKALPKV